MFDKVYAFDPPTRDTDLTDLLASFLDIVIMIMAPIIILMIVVTGFLFVVAQGNPQKLETARRALLWTVIGGVIILGSKAISLGLQSTINLF